MGILIGSAVLPIALAMTWDRLTGEGMIAGSVGGTALALISWLAVSSTYEGGLYDFFKNTGREVSMLCGNLVSIISGGVITFVVSVVLSKYRSFDSSPEIWENTRDIDSPLNPWTELYAKELDLMGAHQLDNRPSLYEVSRAFRNAKLVAQIGAVVLSVVLVILWPALMIPIGVFSFSDFSSWVTLSEVWAIVATIFIIITPVLNEIWDIYHAFKHRKRVGIEPEVRTRVEKVINEPEAVLETIDLNGIKGFGSISAAVPTSVISIAEAHGIQEDNSAVSVF
ncbi:hypothetical protein ScPMuIL_008766 [Solemya velum]